MKIKLNSDNELSLNKMIKIPSMIIVASAVFRKYKKYYLQVFLDSPFINYRPERNRTFLYFTYFFINYHCIIDSCWYLLLHGKI